MAKNDILQAEKNTEVQEDEMTILWNREFQSRMRSVEEDNAMNAESVLQLMRR